MQIRGFFFFLYCPLLKPGHLSGNREVMSWLPLTFSSGFVFNYCRRGTHSPAHQLDKYLTAVP